MAVAAPGRSNWPAPTGAAVSFGSRYMPATTASAPTGTLIQKMSCQPAHVVSAPPSRTPAATDKLPTAPHSARPRVRCAPVYVVVMSASAAGVMRAAPAPWAARALISSPALPAKPDSSDAVVKMLMPGEEDARRGSRSVIGRRTAVPPLEVSR
jgi:hypothetical protein